MNLPTLSDMMKQAGDQHTCWSFVTYYRGVYQHSPRTFDTIEEALRAVVTKLQQHALDHEYPMCSLIRLEQHAKDNQHDQGSADRQ
jgi:hypothetical protein